ncbi:MAG: hypothetical protein BWY76_02216 [bacterium ADurb.Bin429]|nr:MAG: hypothetical protein BWY76_02216 [bacterium ADurb.Bin429]
MAKGMKISSLLKQAAALPKADEQWVMAVHLARTWVAERQQQPHRPYLLIAISNSGYIMGTRVYDAVPSAETVLAELLGMMLHPTVGAGEPRRPALIGTNDADLLQSIMPALDELAIDSGYAENLPMLDEPLAELEQAMNAGIPPLPSLTAIPGASDALLTHYFQMTADYYRAAVWRDLTDEFPLEIRFPTEAKPRYAVVMGNAGEVFGLAVYDTKDALQALYRPGSPARTTRRTTGMALMYDYAYTMSFDDLDAIKAHDWPIAAPEAYPMLTRIRGGREMADPTLADLQWLGGALPGILALKAELRESRLRHSAPLERTVTVEAVDGAREVLIRCPAFNPYLAG